MAKNDQEKQPESGKDAGQKLRSKSQLHYALPPVIDLANAAKVKGDLEKLIKKMKPGAAVALDAAAVEKITTPGVQLMIALQKTVAAQEGRILLAQVSAAFEQAFSWLGLTAMINEWSESNGESNSGS